MITMMHDRDYYRSMNPRALAEEALTFGTNPEMAIALAENLGGLERQLEDRYENDISSMNEALDAQSEKIDGLQFALSIKEREIENLEAEVEKLESRIAELERSENA